MHLVIVESPTKAKTIRKFLGKDYEVVASMGHVRDLPASSEQIPEKFRKQEWANLGVNVDKDFEPLYVVSEGKTKVIRELKALLKHAEDVYLATDEDREGESISWHLLQILKPSVPVKRMVFHEITKTAIAEALAHPRDIDEKLVRAQETRRILDRERRTDLGREPVQPERHEPEEIQPGVLVRCAFFARTGDDFAGRCFRQRCPRFELTPDPARGLR